MKPMQSVKFVHSMVPIVTLTPNTGLDLVIFLDHFAWEEALRAKETVLSMGGKATDAAMVMAELGSPSLALGFAAGEAGRRMAAMLESVGAATDFVWVEGETRTNYVIVNRGAGVQTTITTQGMQVREPHLAQLDAKLTRALENARCLVLGGSLPPGVPPTAYARWIRMAREQGVFTIFDASGEGLRAGLVGQPHLVKPNQLELEGLVGVPVRGVADAVVVAQRLREQGIEYVLVTLGDDGAVAVSRQNCYFIPSLPVPRVVNSAGAGDGMIGGIAHVLGQGGSWEDALRLGTAAAAAVLLTPGTAVCHRADVEAFLPQVRLELVASC
ncbi:MAG TPA: 1-phosphofructokinase family hexose kinase [Anaerolineae bacterium]|nr:1-phosphofructokinase family hexose kinase [Anaerolineae bacterium]